MKNTYHFTCTSANVTYCITCTLCKKLYIGETGRRLGDPFREHLRDLEKDDKNASKPVARHFNLSNSLRPFPTSSKHGKPRNSRTKIYFSNRQSYSSRYQRTLFIQLILYSVVFHDTVISSVAPSFCIAVVTGSNPVEVLIFFRLLLSNCLNWKIYCDDHSSLSSTTKVHIACTSSSYC